MMAHVWLHAKTYTKSFPLGETQAIETGKKRVNEPFQIDDTKQLNGSLEISNGGPWTAERLKNNNFEWIAMNGRTVHE